MPPVHFNIMIDFFIEKDIWVYRSMIYLRWMLHTINIYYFILFLLLAINYFIFKLMALEQDNKLKKFKVLSLDNILAKGHCLKKRKISSSAKTSTCSATIFIWLSSCEQLLKKFHFEFLHFFNFPALEINLDPNFLELYYVFVQVCHKFATSKRRLII